MPKHKLTPEDFEANPILKKMGLKPGDEIETTENEESDEEDGGGGNHPDDPPGKP